MERDVLYQRQIGVKEVGPPRRVAADVADRVEIRACEAAVYTTVAEVMSGGNHALVVGPLVSEGLETAESVVQEARIAIWVAGGRCTSDGGVAFVVVESERQATRPVQNGVYLPASDDVIGPRWD